MGFWKDAKKEFRKGIEETEQALGGGKQYTGEDAEAVAESMRHDVDPDILRKRKLGRAPLERIDEDESLQYLLKGFDLDIDDNDEGHRSQLIVTDKKVIMIASSITGKTSQYTVAYHDIIGVSVQRRLRSHIRIQTAGHSYKVSVTASQPTLAEDVAEYIRKRKDEINNGGNDAGQESPIEKLERLAELKEQGIVTGEEFEAKKAELLDEI